MLKEFKNFVMTGSVIDFAVALIMATAMMLVITGFVNDIIMPIVGHFVGGTDFAEMVKVLDTDAEGNPTNVIRYGAWINSIINLILVGIVMFMIVKSYNKSKESAEDAPAGPSEVDLLTEIRDNLKK